MAHRYFDGQQECYWHLHERGVIKSRGSTQATECKIVFTWFYVCNQIYKITSTLTRVFISQANVLCKHVFLCGKLR